MHVFVQLATQHPRVATLCTSFNMRAELQRQGVHGRRWRFSDINQKYKLAPTYPTTLCVPLEIKDEHLSASAEFRSRGRIPVLTWYSAANDSALMRCAQPLTGAMGRVCEQDEQIITEACRDSSALIIFDARSYVAMAGNRLAGKGTEDTGRYGNCSLVYLDLCNIHALRESHDKLIAAATGSEEQYLVAVADSLWMHHVRSMLRGAVMISRHIGEKPATCALVHCSDGWDRTPTLCSLVQIILDPYFR